MRLAAWYVCGMAQGTAWSEANVWLIAVLAMALILRLAWVLHLPIDEAALNRLPDQREYLELGRNLLRGDGLQFVDPRFDDTVYAFRTPGYPLLVAMCGGDVRVLRIFQAMLDTSSVLAVYLLARRWLARRAALFAAAVVAVNPFLVYFCGLVLSETLFTAMLVWGMALLVVPVSARLRGPVKSALPWLAGAALLALSVLVRPSAVALPIFLGIAAAMVNRHSPRPYDWRWSPPVASLMLILILLALLPWAWRNHRVLGSWVWTTTNSGITLYDGFNPDATGTSDQRFVRMMPQLRTMNEMERSQYLSERAWEFIREHPLGAARLAVVKIARTWSPMPLSSDYGADRRLIAVSLLYMVPLYALVVLGLWRGAAPRSAKMFLMAPAVYFTIVHAASVGSLRYRIPADVPMAIVGAVGCALAHQRFGGVLEHALPRADRS